MTPPKSSILVVEDELIYRSLLEQTLKDEGFDVVSAANGQEALSLLEKIRVDLILSDIRMPKMDGYAFYQKVQAMPGLQTVPFLFLTALADKPHVVKGLELGVDDYITKPVDVDSLLAVIRGKLKHASAINKHVKEGVEQLKSEIIHTLTHEFKTPLNIITGVSSFLLNENLSFQPEELSNLLKSIKRGGSQLTQLVDDFVTVMNIENGTMQQFYDSQKAPEDMPGILQDVVESQQHLIEEHKVEIAAELPDSLPKIAIARAQVRDVLSRLLEYAIASSDVGGVVKFTASYARGVVTVEIANTGHGISQEQLAQIFQKFSQLEGAEGAHFPTGLSLFIAKRLAEINKCDLSCVSEKGSGTCFTLTLPL
jgi:signal transduction histidine kinase